MSNGGNITDTDATPSDHAGPDGLIIRPVRPADANEWLAMRMALWPEVDEALHRREMSRMLSEPERWGVLVCEGGPRGLLGFVEVSLRDWAEGCLSSPVGYLEGWYVRPESRGTGVGRRLVEAAEAWARARGCTEMGSDTDLGNTQSEAAHLRLGFEIAARVIAFRKRL